MLFSSFDKIQLLERALASVCFIAVMFGSSKAQAVDIQAIYNAEKSQNIHLTQLQQKAITNKKLKAVLVWHGSSPWVSAVSRGATEEFAALGIEVVATTDAQFDPAKQVADLENIAALKPDIILSLSVDGASTKASYQKVIADGAKLVLLSNPVPDFVLHQDYVGIVTDDMLGMGQAAAELMAAALNNKGKVGIIYHDADYFITNNRDSAFRKAMTALPNLTIVAQKGFVKEHETSNIAAAMILQHPELNAIYVSWDTAAEGVIEALRSAGRQDIRVISHDLGMNNLLDMAMSGNMYGTVSDRPYDIGQTMARLGAGATIGLKAAPFTLVPFDKVTKNNVADIWQQAFKSEVPRMLNLALKQ
ncbi:substrate-binding domain-containing protein [Pseudoalteromonas tunicata]|uniref:Sugar binding protein of sugar ABC transporter n=1 Tax=Pseudoalteromonas tunicata D2 TaxID=87626 RepID=A4C3S0_9GAMM|nr:substrate-binding domain-containing protein [Pseudoalteromonas tunicata]ATC96519.1 hypothetical protein PTUN_b0046 [Pseudoalteromonas tunicata]AXT33387.1 sugar ABC transporter substrate-binding protein [Pseudoalteromonas tunicata]EAR30202.1 sugar binding protein of sugar ABC transporter [Pseudoalteromonas tunicata D2]